MTNTGLEQYKTVEETIELLNKAITDSNATEIALRKDALNEQMIGTQFSYQNCKIHRIVGNRNACS